MLRKLLLAAVLTAGTVGGFAATTSTASAHERDRDRDRDRDCDRDRGRDRDRDRDCCYKVYYHCRHGWECCGTYSDYREAERCSYRYERNGYECRIERGRR